MQPHPSILTLLLLALVVMLACTPSPTGHDVAETPANDDPPAEALERARSASRALGGALLEHLGQAMEAGGPEQAMRVCSETAQNISQEHSKDGLVVRRVSLKYRNPADRPDAFEERALSDLEDAHGRGELPEETSAVIDDGQGRRLRYMRPIVVGEVCLNCHGGADSMDPAVAALLPELYPEDLATGYALGDFRGAISVTVNLD